jgi:hypothetical protein
MRRFLPLAGISFAALLCANCCFGQTDSAPASDSGLNPILADSAAVEEPPTGSPRNTSASTPATHGIVYDNGWILRPFDPQATPFELKVSLQNQFRYTGFANDEPAVLDAAGNVVPTPPLNTFDINRGRLIFSGYALDPNLEFYANFDYNTVSETPFQPLLAWIRHNFGPEFKLSYGLGKVPGAWEWQEAARNTLGAERSLATTFFRPSITTGIWAEGEPRPGWHYQALVGNGFNTFTLRSAQLDTNFVYSGMTWVEPLGDFGPGFSDFERHDSPVARLGHAYTFNRQDADPTGGPGPEQTLVRLSDGTRVIEPGALAPGVTVNRFDLSLYAAHAALKYAGISLSSEYFFRWLSNIRANGPVTENQIFDHGFYVQGATYVIPKSIEVFARGSAIYGPFGNGSELSAGWNWYVSERQNQRFTFDAARINHSPAEQDRTGFQAGASGLLFRVQMWTVF